MLSSAEWQLQPSKQQRWLNALILLLLMLLLWQLLAPLWAVAGVVLLMLLMRLSARFQASRIGYDRQGWWLERQGQRRYVEWRNGSIRRRDLLLLNYGLSPWCSLLIRRDSLASDEDFRRLKAALYGLW